MKQLKEFIMESIGSKTTLKEGLFDDIDKLEGKNGLDTNVKQLKKDYDSTEFGSGLGGFV